MFTATKSMDTLTRLLKVIGSPMAVMIGAGADAQVNADLLSKAILALTQGLSSDRAMSDMAKDLLETTRCDGKQILFDTHFAGRIGHLFRVLAMVIEVQWKDFFSDLTALAAGEVPPAPQPA